MLLILGVIIAIVVAYGLFYGPPLVPTHHQDIEALFDHIKINGKTFVDLGSGDGRVLKAAVNNGAKLAIGYEVNPFIWLSSRVKLRKNDNVDVKLGKWQGANLESHDFYYVFGSNEKWMQRNFQDKFTNKTLITYGARVPGRAGGQTVGALTIYQPVADNT